MGCSTKTTCPYCGVGCGLIATVEDNGTVTIEGDKQHPANFGRLCSKGVALGETVGLDGRLLHPQINGQPAEWDLALDLVADAFAETIRKHGPNSVAFYVSGQILTEDYYVANKLMKGFIGSANIDTNSRLCMASSVAGHKRAFGSDTVPGTYEDLEKTDLLVLVGSNLAWCHPVLYQRIVAAKAARPDMKVVLIDPRRTMTHEIADLHLAIDPDGDAALFCGLLAHLAEQGQVDRDYIAAHTEGFDEALEAARALTLSDIAKQTGLTNDVLNAFYALWSDHEKVVTVYSQGVNQSSVGSDKVNAIINCHLMTGRIGRPGMGPFSITGQPNAMGGREVGGLANMLAAHMDINNPDHRDRVQRFWNSPTIANQQGMKAVDLFDAVADGRIKALWIMATNPVDSMPDGSRVEEALKNCPFVVVSDVLEKTDTARHAHVALPSLAWGEKNGTVTNSERRISRQKSFLPSPGEARADWWQLAEVGKRMGFASAFDFDGEAAIFREYASLTGFENDGSRDLDIGAYDGVNNADYDDLEPFQWPKPKDAIRIPGDTRFFANGGFFRANGRAAFVAVSPPNATGWQDTGQFVLNTGRVRDHWHTMTRTGRSPRLSSHIAEPFVEVHPEDAARNGLQSADLVRVRNRLGDMIGRVLVTDRVQRGQLFVPMHFTDQNSASGRVNRLVAPVVDAVSGQPALKTSRAAIERFDASFYGFVVLEDTPKLDQMTYWATAKVQGGWRAEFASENALDDPEMFARTLFNLAEDTPLLLYEDRSCGLIRAAIFRDGVLQGALFMAPEPVTVSRKWAADQLGLPFEEEASRWHIVAGRPASDQPDEGALVCSCMNVGKTAISDAVRKGCHTVDAIGATTSAGTNCGSCRAEIKDIINEHQIIAAE